jgi:hypothetical protein
MRWPEHRAALRRSGRYDEILAERGELGGRLEAYRATAVDGGVVEDVKLVALYQRAHDLLYLPPLQVGAARNAVRGYRIALRHVLGGGGEQSP